MAIIPGAGCAARNDSASGAQVIDSSLKFDSSLSQHLIRTPSSSTGNKKQFTLSFWTKVTDYTGAAWFNCGATSGTSGNFQVYIESGQFVVLGETGLYITSAPRFRDSGWYHFVVAVDSSQSIDADRVKIYANGTQITDFSYAGYCAQDHEFLVNTNTNHEIGNIRNAGGTQNYWWDGYISQWYCIDGATLEPSEFGYTDPLTNTWRPKKYTGDYNSSAGGDSIVSGATVLTWDDSPIGNYDLTNSDKTATTNDGGTGYANGDVWSIAIAANTTYAFTLDITNGDSTGGWYFTDSQTDSNTHADERGGNSCGLRGGETSMGTHGTFATANGTSSGQAQITVNSAVSPNGTKKIDFVVYRPSSGDGKVWIRGYGASSWLGGGDPTNTSSTATFAIPDGTTYFGMTAYSRGTAQVFTFDGLVTGATGVNSFYLPFDGNTPIGYDQSNPNPINGGATWSNSLSTNDSLTRSGYEAEKGFNGVTNDTGNYASTLNYANNLTLTFGPSAPITYNSSVEVMTRNSGAATIAFDGTTVTAIDMTFQTVATGSGTISDSNTIVIDTTSTSQYATLVAIRVDNVVLVNNMFGNGWTPVNCGSSIINKSTGALPILNTQNGGKVATPGIRGQVGIAVTVFDSGSGDKFYLDGVETLSLEQYRGQTVTFDLSDSTNASHPLRFSTTSDGTHGGGSEYSEGKQEGGTPGSVGAATTITYPHNAADTLYYYCPNHAAMGGSVELSTDARKADPYAWRNVLALPLVGNSYGTSYKTPDVGVACTSTIKTVTKANSVVASTEQSNFYGGSWYFDGSSSSLNVTASSDFNFEGGDYTIEWWQWWNAVGSYQSPFDCGYTDADSLLIQSGSGSSLYTVYAQGSTIFAESSEAPLKKWTHYALVRNGTSMKLYRDGSVSGSGINSGTTHGSSTHTFKIGEDESNYTFNGYIQDFRVYKGVAKYVNDFMPASTNPDILPDTPSGVVYSSDLTKVIDGAVTFGTDDYLQIPDSADFTFGTGDFTIECWVYCDATAGHQSVIQKYTTDNASSSWFYSVYQYYAVFYFYYGSSQVVVSTDPLSDWPGNSWVHLAVVRDGNDLKIYQNGELANTGDVTGLTLNDSSTPIRIGLDSDGNYPMSGRISNVRIVKGTALYNSNFTPPKGPLADVTNTKLLCCQSPSNVRLSPVAPTVGITTNTRFNSNFETIPTTVNGLTVTNNSSVSTTSAGTNDFGFTNCADLSGSNSLSVDLGAIPQVSTYDIIFKVTGTANNKYLFAISNTGIVRRTGSSLAWYNNNADQVLSTTPDDGNWHHLRVTPTRLYFDGTETVNTSANPNIYVSSNGYMALGAYRNDSGTIQYNGEVDIGLVRVMPGVDLGPPTIPITTNGTLSSTETIPTDGVIFANGAVATSSNPFTTNINTVMGQESGYCTWNPLTTPTNTNYTDGNLTLTKTGTSHSNSYGTMGMTTGKWYWEISKLTSTGDGGLGMGLVRGNRLGDFTSTSGTDRYLIYLQSNIIYYYDGDTTENNFSSSAAFNDNPGTFMFAFDADNQKLYFGKDGNWTNGASGLSGGNPSIGSGALLDGFNAGETYFPWCTPYTSGQNMGANFGQKPFKFPPPEGFKILNYANLPSPEFVRPDSVVGVTTYTGTGAVQTVTGLNFQSDLIWIKSRTGVYNWRVFDSVRGFGSGKALYPDLDEAQGNNSGNDGALSTHDNGWTFTTTGARVNDATQYAAWCWKAGGSKNTFNVDDVGYASAAAAGLDGGTLTPSGASVGTKQGFSILKWNSGSSTGDFTLSHGLGNVPRFIIQKQLDTGNWWVYHADAIDDMAKYLQLNSSNAVATNSANMWGASAPTSSVFGVRVGDLIAASTDAITYLWADIPGVQKFGKYTGNDSSDGPFIELGFRPALIIIKGMDFAANWFIFDNKRTGSNPTDQYLLVDSDAATGGVAVPIDFLSNGFKVRFGTAGYINNTSSYNFIYCAWAEQPMNNFYGAQSNAR